MKWFRDWIQLYRDIRDWHIQSRERHDCTACGHWSGEDIDYSCLRYGKYHNYRTGVDEQSADSCELNYDGLCKSYVEKQ